MLTVRKTCDERKIKMKIWVTLDSNDKINASGFEKFSPNAFEASSTTYTIDDCVLEGTDFQKRVWKAISEVPAGKTKSYGELVAVCGGSPQSVGTACGKNKLPGIIPCHRIVGKKNKLAYSGGSEIKRKLLLEEGVTL